MTFVSGYEQRVRGEEGRKGNYNYPNKTHRCVSCIRGKETTVGYVPNVNAQPLFILITVTYATGLRGKHIDLDPKFDIGLKIYMNI